MCQSISCVCKSIKHECKFILFLPFSIHDVRKVISSPPLFGVNTQVLYSRQTFSYLASNVNCHGVWKLECMKKCIGDHGGPKVEVKGKPM